MPDLPPPQNKSGQAPLFTLRIWREDLGDGEITWRGKIQNVASGESHYFQGWYALIEMLQAMLNPDYGPPQDPGAGK